MIQFLRRFASRTVQRAHARVTAENERYVREAIARDAENERLTQELQRAKARIEDLTVVVDELRRKQMRSMEVTAERIEELDLLRVQVKALTDQLVELDEMHAEVSARLEQAQEELAGYRTAESIADETRAKRYYDGQGDE